MKNLKINKDGVKKLISAVLITTSLSNLTGCSFERNDTEKNTDNESLQNVVVDNKIISIADLRLKDTKTNEIIENIDAILIGNKLEKEFDLINIIFNSSVESILINDELVSVDRLKLVNSKTNQEIDTIDYALVEDELIPIKDYINRNSNINSDSEYRFSSSKEETVAEEEEYEELTTEKFNALVAEIYKKYSEIGLDVSKEDVIDYMMMVNIDKLATDNNELISVIIGDRNVDEIVLNAFNVYSAIMTENNDRYCAKNLGWDSVILINDTIFDNKERDTVKKIENRVKEIVEAKDSKEEFNRLLNRLLMDMLDAKKEEFNMESGAGYSVVTILMNFIRINFTSLLDSANGELIKYFIVYAGDGVEYEENSRSTAYYRGIYNLMTDCNKSKTLSK